MLNYFNELVHWKTEKQEYIYLVRAGVVEKSMSISRLSQEAGFSGTTGRRIFRKISGLKANKVH